MFSKTLAKNQFNYFSPIPQIEHNSKLGVLEINKNKKKSKDSYLVAIKEV